MRETLSWVLIGLLSGPVLAADAGHGVPRESELRPSPVASLPAVLSNSAAREVRRLARLEFWKPRKVQPTQQQPANKGWIARHPRLLGALVGFGIGCAAGASQVGGSQDSFFNALDEFACPVVGGIGAGAGALVGSLFK